MRAANVARGRGRGNLGARRWAAVAVLGLATLAGAQETDDEQVARIVSWRIEELGHWDARVREEAALELGQIGPRAQPAVTALIRALGEDESGGVRQNAAWAIRRIQPPAWTVSEPLLTALGDREQSVRRNAASALATYGDELVDPLVEIAEGRDALSRLAALSALGQMGSEARRAVPALRALVDHPDEATRRWVDWALELVDTGEPILDLEVAPEPEATPPPAPVPPVVTEPADEEPGVGYRLMITALVLVTAYLVVRVAIQRIRRRDEPSPAPSRDRRPAARAERPGRPDREVGDASRPRAGPLDATSAGSIRSWIRDLESDDEGRRFQAATALGGAGRPSIGPLVQCLANGNGDVRYWAVVALEQLGPIARPAVPALVAIVEDAGEEEALRRFAIQTLGKIGPGAVDGLVRVLGCEASGLRQQAAYALGGIGPEGETAAEPLVRALGDPDHEVRHAAADALGSLGRVDGAIDLVTEALTRAQQDADEGVRGAATAALRSVRGEG